jgi:hypothetical protein
MMVSRPGCGRLREGDVCPADPDADATAPFPRLPEFEPNRPFAGAA